MQERLTLSESLIFSGRSRRRQKGQHFDKFSRNGAEGLENSLNEITDFIKIVNSDKSSSKS